MYIYMYIYIYLIIYHNITRSFNSGVILIITIQTLIGSLPCARCSPKHFICIMSFKIPHFTVETEESSF